MDQNLDKKVVVFDCDKSEYPKPPFNPPENYPEYPFNFESTQYFNKENLIDKKMYLWYVYKELTKISHIGGKNKWNK